MRTVILRLSTAVVLSALAAWPAQAENSKVGTSGAQFLKIGASARATAMGDAYTAIGGDIHSAYYNPAGLATVKRSQLTAMRAQWFQGLDYSYGAFAYPGAFGTLAVSAATLQASDIQRTGSDESALGTFDNLDAAYGLSYATDISEALSFGGTARFIKESIDATDASAWGGDLGALFAHPDSAYSVGLAMRHFGQDLKFQEEGDPQPLVFDLGFAGRLFDRRLTLAANLLSPRDNDLQFGLGAEWAQGRQEHLRFAGRVGYRSLGTDADGATGLTVGGGLGFRRFDFDVAWVPFGDLGNTFRYAITFQF